MEEVLSKLRSFLPEYLLEKGYDISNNRKILCLNPNHDDHTPSMSSFEAEQGYPLIRCHSCDVTYDIFNAVHIVEGKPLVGPGFVTDTVTYLGNKYGVEIPTRELSEDDVYKINTYQAYRNAADFISTQSPNDIQEAELLKRGWDLSEFRKNGGGFCNSYHDFRSWMKNLGWTVKFLDEVDLNNESIFNPHNMIFTMHDQYGRPIGFTARNLKFDGVKEPLSGSLVNGPKYTNTKATGTKYNIFRKHERLYLFHIARDKSSPMYFFEGIPDALTAHIHGLKNSVGILGLNLRAEHFSLCRQYGIYDVVLCFDNDSPGMDKAKKVLDDVLKNIHDIRIRFLFLPGKHIEVDGNSVISKTDPDEYIRDNGMKAFLDLKKVDPFEWKLQQFDDAEDVDAEAVCNTMIPIILLEPSSIRREGMVTALSNYTSISEKAIRAEIEMIKANQDKKNHMQKKHVIDEMIEKLQISSESYEAILNTASDKLFQIEKEANSGPLETTNRVNALLSIKQHSETEDSYSVLNLGENHKTFSFAFAGDLHQKLIFLGGSPNVGYLLLGWYSESAYSPSTP
jgi:DNA primase catalytic core